MEKMPESGGQEAAEENTGEESGGVEQNAWEELGGAKQNVRAEWEALKNFAKMNKEFVKYDARTAKNERGESLDEEERARFQRVGERFLRAIDLMSEGADDEKLVARMERARKMADRIGYREKIESEIVSHIENKVDSPAEVLKMEERMAAIKRSERPADSEGYSELERQRHEASERRGGIPEAEFAEKLKAEAVELKEADLSAEFPSGNYLFHGADVKHMKQILESGKLMNALAVAENTGVGAMASANSGGEGISWSMNGIDALPGTRGHLAGFLAAPEMVLGDETKAVIPSRPAPYEVLQIGGEMNGKEFFELKKQVEVWGDRSASFTDKASVDSNLIFLGMDSKFSKSLLGEYAERGGMPAEKLREHFTVDEEGKVKLDEQLHQQKFDENFVPPGAVYLQSLIDRGKAKEVLGLPEDAEMPDVNGIIEMMKGDKDLRIKVAREARGESEEVLQRYNEEWEKAKGIELPISEMYFVCSHGDLDAWTKVLAGAGQKPKGILLYDDKQVVLPNFASPYKGNHGELTAEIGEAVKVNSEFWKTEMGMDVESLERAGSQGQVLREEDVRHDQEIKMVDGELKLETVE